MVHVREEKHVTDLAFGLQSRNILQSVHQMHIVISRTVHEQKPAIHVTYTIYRSAFIIAILVFTRSEHKTLGIYSVIVAPVGYREQQQQLPYKDYRMREAAISASYPP